MDAAFLQNSIFFPGPCDLISPYNFPDQGFYIAVADAEAYADAISEKIQTVVDATLPEPMTLALFGIGLIGARVMRRRAA